MTQLEAGFAGVITPVPAARRLWAGRIVSAIPVLFLIFDASIKLVKLTPVVDAFAQLGYPINLAPTVGVLALVCTAVYAIPRTSVLGAVLLTGYLGGAIATQVRIEAGVFPVIFPVIIGALVWTGLYLRDHRLRLLIRAMLSSRAELSSRA
jgi:hypothetical protein